MSCLSPQQLRNLRLGFLASNPIISDLAPRLNPGPVARSRHASNFPYCVTLLNIAHVLSGIRWDRPGTGNGLQSFHRLECLKPTWTSTEPDNEVHIRILITHARLQFHSPVNSIGVSFWGIHLGGHILCGTNAQIQETERERTG